MKLTAIREALERILWDGLSGKEHPLYAAAKAEAVEVEGFLRKAEALTTYAIAGLSAFHGHICSGSVTSLHEKPPAECVDAKCRAWAAALMERLAPTTCCGEQGKCSDCPPTPAMPRVEMIPLGLLDECADSVGSTSGAEGHSAVWRLVGEVDRRLPTYGTGGPVASAPRDARLAAIRRQERELADARIALESARNSALEEAARCVEVEAQESHTREVAAVLDEMAARIRARKKGG